MFVSEKLIFLQLQKTAGTHIAALLQRHLGGRMLGKHGPLDFDPGGRLVVGSVRNPWDWYVSLWAYGCSVRGGVQVMLNNSRAGAVRRILGAAWRHPAKWPGALRDTRRHLGRDVEFWRSCYADPTDPVAFRRWLKAVFSPEGRRLLGADYADRPLADFAGLYTYRFLSIFTPRRTWKLQADRIMVPEDVGPFFERHGVVQRFVRTERLEEDLAAILAEIGRPEITAELLRGERINASRRGAMETYHDAESIALIASADRFVVGKFGYAPPRALSTMDREKSHAD